MYTTIWFVLMGIVAWSIGNMTGQEQYGRILGADPSVLEIVLGIVGAIVGCHLFLNSSSIR
jgi:uncharacterized membrane protein YeaQ/YmgE (transglycosylase-associated protein family)